MEILMLLIYGSICWVVFKVFKVPVNKWSITTAALGGFLMIFLTVLTMNYNHPFTSNARVFFVTTPIIPNVSGEVTKVYIEGLDQVVEKGDTLFTMDSTIFESHVESVKASLALAKMRLYQSRKLVAAEAGSRYDLQEWEAEVKKLKGQLIESEFNLKSCVVLAQTNGKIIQNRLRPGMRAVQFPLRPVLTLMDTERQYIVGAFPQNPIQRLKIGNEAEVAFDAIPGKIFKGELVLIGDAVAQGELQAEGNLYNFDLEHSQGSIPMIIQLTDSTDAYFIPGGAKAQMAIYSEYMHPVKILRKMLLRMNGWLNFVFGEH